LAGLTTLSTDCVLTAAVTVLVLLGAWFDWRARRLPNLLTLSAWAGGLIWHCGRGWNGCWVGLQGSGLGLALLLLPYLFGGLKAGDVKFLAAIGAWVGAAGVLRILLVTVLCYPLLVIVPVLRERKLRLTLRRFGRVLGNFLGFFATDFKLLAQRWAAPDQPELPSVRTPFGVALAAGTLLALYTEFLR
jgi:prepilin peptidase CpaA